MCIKLNRTIDRIKSGIKNEEEWDDIYTHRLEISGKALKYIPEEYQSQYLNLVKNNKKALKYVKNQTDEVAFEAVKAHGLALKYVHNQTSRICIAAIKQHWSAIKYVKKQTKKLCALAVKKNRMALGYINIKYPELFNKIRDEFKDETEYHDCDSPYKYFFFDRSEKNDRIFVKHCVGCIKYLDNVSDAIYIDAIKEYPKVIKYAPKKIQDQFPKLKKLFVTGVSFYDYLDEIRKDYNFVRYLKPWILNNQIMCNEIANANGLTLQYLGYVEEDTYYLALRQNGLALKYIHRQSIELCLEAVKQNGLALEHIHFTVYHENTDNMIIRKWDHKISTSTYLNIVQTAVAQNGLALEFAPYQTYYVCYIAVKQNGLAIKYVREQVEELCLIAVKNNPWALKYVKIETPEIASYSALWNIDIRKKSKYGNHLPCIYYKWNEIWNLKRHLNVIRYPTNDERYFIKYLKKSTEIDDKKINQIKMIDIKIHFS